MLFRSGRTFPTRHLKGNTVAARSTAMEDSSVPLEENTCTHEEQVPRIPTDDEIREIALMAVRSEYNQNRGRGGADSFEPTCHLCGQKGHFVRDCSLLQAAREHLSKEGFLEKKGGAEKNISPPPKKGQA